MKLVASLITALLIAAGLTLATGPAQADHNYVPHTDTICQVRPDDATLRPGQKVRTDFRQRIANSTRTIQNAAVVIKFRNTRDGDVVRATTRNYDGGWERWSFAGPRAGRYRVTFHANPRNDQFRNCSDAFILRVRR